MNQEQLNKLGEIDRVSVPEFLLDKIKNKIDAKQKAEKRTTNLAFAFAFLLLVANAGVLTTYSEEQNTNSTSQTINPYAITESTFVGYE